jgi:uncharacterized linocin/CFP29 family protein
MKELKENISREIANIFTEQLQRANQKIAQLFEEKFVCRRIASVTAPVICAA